MFPTIFESQMLRKGKNLYHSLNMHPSAKAKLLHKNLFSQ